MDVDPSPAKVALAALAQRDLATASHCWTVGIYAADIAVELGLEPALVELARLAGRVHDVGKIGLPPGLIEKPGALTVEEQRSVQRHSEMGEQILRAAEQENYTRLAQLVRHHHERIDGLGYPDGISGDGIPRVSRIVAAAETYNTMTSHQPWRDAMPSRVARLRLAQAAGTQLDEQVVQAFERILARADDEYLTASGDRFSTSAW